MKRDASWGSCEWDRNDRASWFSTQTAEAREATGRAAYGERPMRRAATGRAAYGDSHAATRHDTPA